MNQILKQWLYDAIGETHNVSDLIAEIDASEVAEPDPRAYARTKGCEFLRTFTIEDTLPMLGIDPRRLDIKYGDGTSRRLLANLVDGIEDALFGPHAENYVDYDLILSETMGRLKLDRIFALTDDTRIGHDLAEAASDASAELRQYVKPLPPNTDAYRINDDGDYVSVEDWHRVWDKYPSYFEHIWLVCDNGQFSRGEVENWTLGELERFFASDDFVPEYAYFTDTGEEGVL